MSHDRLRALRTPFWLLAVGSLVAVAGCSSVNVPASGSTTTTTASPPALEATSAADIANAAAAALDNASSVEVASSVVIGAGTVLGKYRLYENGSGAGIVTVGVDGRSLQAQVIVVGESIYLRAPEAFWKIEGDVGPAERPRLSSHWVVTPSFRAPLALWMLSLSVIARFVGSMTEALALQKNGTETVNGQRAVGVISSNGIALWVAASNAALPISYTDPDPAIESFAFSDWNQGTPPTSPSAAIPLPAS